MLEDKLYDVEHALMMHAYSFAHFPAFAIYDDEVLSQFQEVISNCHIYLIGLLPKVELKGARQVGEKLVLSFSVLGFSYDIDWPIPEGFEFHEDEGHYCLANTAGKRIFPSVENMIIQFHAKTGKLNFNIQYIGQAYGKDGSRNAIDRLKKHETLQKISLQGIPDGYNLELLLLEIQPSNKIMTTFNPHALDQNHGDERIASGIEKLFETNEHERITLYEASLIRYFRPKYNKEFRESFPSTNLQVLKDCYDKDFTSIVAEICFDHMPYYLCSDRIEPQMYHIIQHDLHKAENRRLFFT